VTLKAESLSKSVTTVIENGRALLDDAKLLFDWDRFSTAFSLSVLAQEEFAKAFLLQLIEDEALPWRPEVRRAIANHLCKHVLALVMEWLPAQDWENLVEQARSRDAHHKLRMEWLQRRIDRYKQGMLPDPVDPEPIEPDVSFPSDVVAALNIFRHEQIEKLRFARPWKDEGWATGGARRIADGWLDRRKQSAFYVDITKTGEVGLHPGLITREDASEAIGRAERLAEGSGRWSAEYRKLKEVLPLLFSTPEG